MRSVLVVFPASMLAMMPMLRIRSSGVVLGISFLYSAKTRGDRGAHRGPVSLRSSSPRLTPGASLPPVMCESPIGFRHPVRVFLLLDRLALALRSGDQLGGVPLRHVLLAPRPAVLDQPPHPQRRAPLGSHLDRHLVGRAAHAAGLDLERRLHVRQRLLEHVHARLPGALL